MPTQTPAIRPSFRAFCTILALAMLSACGEPSDPKPADKGCDGGDRSKTADCTDQTKYEADLKAIAKARPAGADHHAVVHKMVADRLTELGYTVDQAAYGVGANVVGELKGTGKPDEIVIIGAHYDGVPDCPAADDNGTGVAGALQAAAALARHKHDRTLQIVLWDEEERGLVGSFMHANQLADAGRKVAAVYDFEMIGYISDQPNTQNMPAGFEFIFTEAGKYLADNGKRGDFIAAIYGKDDTEAYKAYAEAGKKHGLPVIPVGLDAAKMEAGTLSDLRRSDHASYWSAGYPAIMLTDTANFRNTHYHCDKGPDTVDRLDHGFALKVVKSAIDAATLLLKDNGGKAYAPYAPACDLDKQDCPAGKKCTPFSHGSRYVATCMDIAATPVKKWGEACKRNGKLGDDNCDKGLVCSPWGQPQDGTETKFMCIRPCATDKGCSTDEVCTVLGRRPYGSTVAPRRSGACVKKCDPWASTCATGMMCGLGFLAADSLKDVFTCMSAGKGELGKTCQAYNWGACAPGSDCMYGPKGADEVCATRCDAKHPCPTGKSCAGYAFSALAGIGHCF